MNKGFWDKLAWPIVGLSPMDGVTDASMRFVAKKYGQPDIIYTEFVSAEGLWRIKKRGDMEHKIWNELKYSETERPVIAQLFGSDPESFYEAAKICVELGFDGVDINMGCPSPGLEKRGGGAGLIRDKCNAIEVVEATRRGAGNLPVSVKTRIGSDAPDPEWWKTLADMKLPAVAMHGRTFKQLYSGEADWEVLLQAAEVIRASGAKFLGNGDIKELKNSRNQELKIVTKSGREIDLTGKMDGVLIGREAMGNPWVLNKNQKIKKSKTQNEELKEKLAVMVEQAKKYEEIFKNSRNQELKNSRQGGGTFQFFPMRKHLACFARGFEGSSGLRKKLMAANNAEEVEMMVEEFLMNMDSGSASGMTRKRLLQ